MNRRSVLLLACLILSLLFAVWQWTRPYERHSDPAARFKMVHASVTRDHGNLWLDLYLKHLGGEPHDLSKPVILHLEGGREFEPASTTMEGETGTQALAFRFWLEDQDFTGAMNLKINDGTLSIRDGSGVPEKLDESARYFTTTHW